MVTVTHDLHPELKFELKCAFASLVRKWLRVELRPPCVPQMIEKNEKGVCREGGVSRVSRISMYPGCPGYLG